MPKSTKTRAKEDSSKKNIKRAASDDEAEADEIKPTKKKATNKNYDSAPSGNKPSHPLQVPLESVHEKEKSFVKIISWNVNSIRSCCKADPINRFKEYVDAEQPDIICCQETKVSASTRPKNLLAGYEEEFWNVSEQAGYAGTAIFSKIKPLSVQYGMGGDKELDAEGRLICLEFGGFYLINTYVPNAGMKLDRLEWRTTKWDVALLAFLQKLQQKKPILWCGDLNVAHQEIDLANPKSNKKTPGFTIQERESFSKILAEAKLIDTFRSKYPEKQQFTFYSYKRQARDKGIGWRLDYFVASQAIVPLLPQVFVRDKVYGSDHVPLGLLLDKQLLTSSASTTST